MNYLIKAMAAEASSTAHGDHQGSFVKYDPNWFATYNEKFAELIIKQCANLAREKQRFTGYDIAEYIESKFEVA